MQEPIYFSLYNTEAKLCRILVTYCTDLIQVLIFNQMQIPCNGHVCFLLNMSAVVIGTFMRTISFMIITSAPGLPLVSISRRFLGLPASATTFGGSPSSFKGSSNMKWQLCRSILLCIMPFAPSTTQFWFQFCQTFTCTLSGILVHHSSNMFIQRHSRSTLVVGSPANSIDVF